MTPLNKKIIVATFFLAISAATAQAQQTQLSVKTNDTWFNSYAVDAMEQGNAYLRQRQAQSHRAKREPRYIILTKPRKRIVVPHHRVTRHGHKRKRNWIYSRH